MPAMRDFQTPTRSAVYAPTAMAATSHPRATLAAIETLKSGGNAMDAAICAGAVLAVIEPQMTGIGGDCFVLYAPSGAPVIAYNGSGAAVAAAEPGWYRDHGMAAIPVNSAHAVTVPGAVEAWHRLTTDHGRMTFAELLAPAIALAEDGFPVPPRISADWARFADKLAATEPAREKFLPGGKPLAPGDIFRQPELAATLRTIAPRARRASMTAASPKTWLRRLTATAGCTAWPTSRPMRAPMWIRFRPAIADTRCSNARPTVRVSWR